MAIIKCPECEKDISDKALTCPHCGYPLKEAVDQNGSAAHNDAVVTEASAKPEMNTSPKKESKSKKGLFITIGVIAVAVIIACLPRLGKYVYMDVVPGMKFEEVKSMYIGKSKYITDVDVYDTRSTISVWPIGDSEFKYFGYPAEEFYVRFDNEKTGCPADIVQGRIDLTAYTPLEIEEIQQDILNKLDKIGTRVEIDYFDYSMDCTYTIDGTEYAVYFYLYKGSSRYDPYMEISVFYSDSGFFHLG